MGERLRANLHNTETVALEYQKKGVGKWGLGAAGDSPLKEVEEGGGEALRGVGNWSPVIAEPVRLDLGQGGADEEEGLTLRQRGDITRRERQAELQRMDGYEKWFGRVAMVAAIWLLVTEATTGSTFAEQAQGTLRGVLNL